MREKILREKKFFYESRLFSTIKKLQFIEENNKNIEIICFILNRLIQINLVLYINHYFQKREILYYELLELIYSSAGDSNILLLLFLFPLQVGLYSYQL